MNIWQMQNSRDVDGLAAALRHPDPRVRQQAAGALKAVGAWHTVPALEIALSAENDWQAHAAIAAAIAYLSRDIHIERMIKDKDVRGLAKMLKSNKPEDVIQAAQALGEMGDQLATEDLVVVFRNPYHPPKVRLAAAEALLKLESAPANVTLLRALRRDDWAVRRNAAAVLGQLQATWAVDPLIETLKDPVPIVRKTAEAALRRIGGREATDALRKYEDQVKRFGTRPLGDPPPSGPVNTSAPSRPSGTIKSATPTQPSSGSTSSLLPPRPTLPPSKPGSASASKPTLPIPPPPKPLPQLPPAPVIPTIPPLPSEGGASPLPKPPPPSASRLGTAPLTED